MVFGIIEVWANDSAGTAQQWSEQRVNIYIYITAHYIRYSRLAGEPHSPDLSCILRVERYTRVLLCYQNGHSFLRVSDGLCALNEAGVCIYTYTYICVRLVNARAFGSRARTQCPGKKERDGTKRGVERTGQGQTVSRVVKKKIKYKV